MPSESTAIVIQVNAMSREHILVGDNEVFPHRIPPIYRRCLYMSVMIDVGLDLATAKGQCSSS